MIVLLTGLTLVAGYANKARCVGPEFDAQGRSTPDFTVRANRDVCYSDIQKLWLGRDIDQHVFPYLTGSITPEGELRGGTVEYPVLSGLLMWVAAVPSHTDGEFLAWSALLMAPFGLADGLDAGPARPLAGAAVGARSTAGALRLPQLGPARWWPARWERCTRCTAGAPPARWPTGPWSPRCCSGSASRSSSTPARSSPRSRCWCSPRPAAARRRTGGARCGSSPPRWSRSCW